MKPGLILILFSVLSTQSSPLAQSGPCEQDQTICANFVDCNNDNTLQCTNAINQNCLLLSCTGSNQVTESADTVIDLLLRGGVNCRKVPYRKWACVLGLPAKLNKTFKCSSNCTPSCEEEDCGEELMWCCALEDCVPVTPILISVKGNKLDLTSAADGVEFDMNGDAVASRMAWTTGNEDDAFLVLDRNGNGLVDNGRELFGSLTPQPRTGAPNGFLALAVFDQAENGGDGDLQITGNDLVFSELRLWVDSSHDGVSQPGELRGLAEAGIAAISLSYWESRREDQHGNQFSYTSLVQMTHEQGGPGQKFAVDVIFVTAPGS